ncbi:serine hydrolase [Paracnuella aquatica]|uniref:serine hydrolase n=1 Tax=Paracnuella aquatica TaxID=2268757 RepID=UPI000DEF5E40|nr:serine hydrolase [Paracnuella aquatica]RPD50671.1 serine hydrolase [Paracnuella aquatica]
MIGTLRKEAATLLLLGCSYISVGQTDSIDVFVQQQMQQRKIPGLQLAIVRNGAVVKTGNYGFANLQDSIAVSNRTVFNLNSITKAFVGVAMLQLAEQGKLRLSAPIATYLNDLPQAWQGVTVQQLLSHTSGIPDVVDEEEAVMIAPTLEASWQKVLAMPMDFAPGAEFRYNQTNYLLLGRIIDTLSGMPFQEFIIKEQLAKVGMPLTIRSGFGATKAIVPHAAAAYAYRQGVLSNTFFSFPAALQTAAGMSATATEVAQWIIALQSGQLLAKKESLDALWQPALLASGNTGGFSSKLNGYAAGWPIAARPEHPAAAAVGGGRSAVFVYPQDNLSIVVLTNLMGGNPEAFVDELAGFFIPDMKAVNGFGLSPSLRLLKGALDKNGYKNAITEVKALRKKRKDFVLNERELNTWGYALIGQKKVQHALEIFKLNVYLYPQSSNAFDSLGELYAALDEKDLAIKNYEQALKLNPNNSNAKQQLQRLKQNK